MLCHKYRENKQTNKQTHKQKQAKKWSTGVFDNVVFYDNELYGVSSRDGVVHFDRQHTWSSTSDEL